MKITGNDVRHGKVVVQRMNYDTNNYENIKIDENGEIALAEPDYYMSMSYAQQMMKFIDPKGFSAIYRIFAWHAPKKKIEPKPIQTLLALSLLFQVKNRLKYKNWMISREVVAENHEIFDRIKIAIERDYNFEVKQLHLTHAVGMLWEGLGIKIVPRK